MSDTITKPVPIFNIWRKPRHCGPLLCAFLLATVPTLPGSAQTGAPGSAPDATGGKPAFQLLLGAGTAPNAGTAAAKPPVPPQEKAAAFYAKPGPWGKLRCFHIFIEAPQSLVDSYTLPGTQPRWSFPEGMANDLPGLFKRVGLPDGFIQSLLVPGAHRRENGMIHFFPAVKEVEAMTPAMREALYPELRKHPINEFYFSPVKITTGTVDEWFGSSNLRPELIAKMRQLAYRFDRCLALSDLSVLFHHASSEAEARSILKALTRTRSLMVQLELPEGTSLEPLLDYWTTGLKSRRKDIEPILESILATGGAERLALSHILPALPRKLLYTFPGPEYFQRGTLPDCHWTSMNFFNYDPHDFYLDERLATGAILETHREVNPPHRYGDILMFYEGETGKVMHSCVYLADDLVFTKNGRNAFSPWIIAKLNELEGIYLHGKTTGILGYRHKQSPN